MNIKKGCVTPMIRVRMTKKMLTTFVLTLVMLLCASSVYADDNQTLSMTLKGTADESGVTLYSQDVKGERYFMLPSGAKAENITKHFENDATYKTQQSGKVSSVFFVSADPKKKGRDYIDGSPDHSTKAKGTVYMYDKDFKLIYSGEVSALKGRGNSTWNNSAKKPYQMKLEEKADLLNPEKESQKSKTWLLLSNPYDPTLIKNTMVYNFGKEIGLESTPEGVPIDMYYDGVYRGAYYLCEKVEIGKNRVDIYDLEEAVEEANPEVEDFDELTTGMDKNSNGNEYTYVEGLKDPEDITGGYLLEMDHAFYRAEKSWMHLGSGYYWVSKSPEYLSKNMAEYISEHSQKFFNYVTGAYFGGQNGEKIFDYIDKESFVKYVLTMELFYNRDTWTSSTYLYKPENDDKFYAGPIWDCDSILGIRSSVKEPTGFKLPGIGAFLINLPEFKKAAKEIYVNEMRPVIFDTLIGEKDGSYLKTYDNMKSAVSDSLIMNDMIWEYNNNHGTFFHEENAEANYKMTYDVLKARVEWFDEVLMSDDYVRKYQVETAVTGGTITDTTKVILGEDVTVNYAPAEGYVLDSVIVDGTAVDLNQFPTSYQFKQVYGNHKIEVTFKQIAQPEPEVKPEVTPEVTPEETPEQPTPEVKPVIGKTKITSLVTKERNVTVKWKKAEGAAAYAIYRSKDGGKTYKKIVTVKGKTSYTSKGLTAGKTYRYRICPIQGKYSGTKCTAKSITVIGKTKNLKAKIKKQKVTLTWTKVKGAKAYQIYRSTNGGKTYKKIVTVKRTKHVTKKMTKGKSYKYKVKAVNGNSYGNFSKVKSVKIK